MLGKSARGRRHCQARHFHHRGPSPFDTPPPQIITRECGVIAITITETENDSL